MALSYPYPGDLQVSNDDRYYVNYLSIKEKCDESEFRGRLRASIAKKLDYLEKKYDPIKDNVRDIYIGSGGMAMLYLHLANTYASDDVAVRDAYLQKCIEIVQESVKSMKQNKIAFLHGPVGIFSIGAVAYKKLKHEAASLECTHSLIAQFEGVFKKKVFPSEILYGQAGYLHALLFVNHHIPGVIPQDLIKQVVTRIIEAGKASGSSIMQSPLSYRWHSKHYIGGAHGMAGIACQLLQAPPDIVSEFKPLIVPLVSYLVSLQKKSGNFPSSLESAQRDCLVQFCHGAPGVLSLLALAQAQQLAIEGLAKAIDSAVELTWSRGLLTKGHGLCHGVSGNAYAFLALYRHTQDPKYIRLARTYAEWIVEREDTEGAPDNPFSLFEGLAGTIYFLADMLDPMTSAFPCYEIPPH